MIITVHDNNVEKALKALKRKAAKEGLLKDMRRKRYYEKRNVDSILSIVDDSQVKSLCGKKNLIETIQLMADSKMILAIDGGMAHLAASLKKDLVTIFGPTNSNNISPVDTYGLLISNQIECSPCYWSDNYYNCPYDRKCLNEINQDQFLL